MAGPPIFPTADDQREATHAERRGAAVNRRTFDRVTGTVESAAAAQERYANLGLEPTTPHVLRDSGGYSPFSFSEAKRQPMDRHPAAESEAEPIPKPMTAEERSRLAETLEHFGFSA